MDVVYVKEFEPDNDQGWYLVLDASSWKDPTHRDLVVGFLQTNHKGQLRIHSQAYFEKGEKVSVRVRWVQQYIKDYCYRISPYRATCLSGWIASEDSSFINFMTTSEISLMRTISLLTAIWHYSDKLDSQIIGKWLDLNLIRLLKTFLY